MLFGLFHFNFRRGVTRAALTRFSQNHYKHRIHHTPAHRRLQRKHFNFVRNKKSATTTSRAVDEGNKRKQKKSGKVENIIIYFD